MVEDEVPDEVQVNSQLLPTHEHEDLTPAPVRREENRNEATDDVTSSLIASQEVPRVDEGPTEDARVHSNSRANADRVAALQESIEAVRAWHLAHLPESMVDLEQQAPEVSRTWTCFCTNLNHEGSQHCEVCFTSRGTALLARRQQPELFLGPDYTEFAEEMAAHEAASHQSLTFTGRSMQRYSMSGMFLLIALCGGSICGTCWAFVIGGESHVADGAILGMCISLLFAFVCWLVSARRRIVDERRRQPLTELGIALNAAQSITPDASPTAAAHEQGTDAVAQYSQAVDSINEQMDAMMGFLGMSLGIPGLGPNPGLAPEVLASFPTRILSAEDVAAAPDGQACTICIENFAEGDEEKTLPCFHRFHRTCIDEWLGRSGVCPICKQRVDDPRE